MRMVIVIDVNYKFALSTSEFHLKSIIFSRFLSVAQDLLFYLAFSLDKFFGLRFFPLDKLNKILKYENKYCKTDKMFDYQNMTKGLLLCECNSSSRFLSLFRSFCWSLSLFSMTNWLAKTVWVVQNVWQTEVFLPRHMNELPGALNGLCHCQCTTLNSFIKEHV